MDTARYAKRARQACEPCRRKKSRCPGERPTCSYCQRLGQRCIYNNNATNDGDGFQSRHDRKMEYRIDSLEGKMDRLIQHLSPVAMSAARQPMTPYSFASSTAGRESNVGDMPWWNARDEGNEQLSDLLVPKENLLAMGQLYLTWCHGQPIALFNASTFLESLTFRDIELILALQTLSLRYPPSTLTPQKRDRLNAMEREARTAVMNRIASSEVDISTLQTLCILSMVEFADGKVAQAGLNLAMASQLAQSVQPNNMLGDAQEFNDCVQSIIMLQNVQGCVPPTTGPGSALAGQPSLSTMPTPSMPPLGVELSSSIGPFPPSQMESGIMKYAVELSEAWRLARAYAACRSTSGAIPPWDQHSDYSTVMHLHLEFDCHVPLKYRFAANKFAEQDQESLEQRRDYWGPWLYIQIVYAVIPCLLNHPFLLSMRLKNFRYTVPQSFIHHSFEYVNRHAGWIVYFVNLLEKKSFILSDPSLAHCIVVVATIHLQHSFVKDRALRDKAQQGFDKCMSFLRRMGGTWPCVSTMANNLAKLKESVGVVRSPASEDVDNAHGRRAFSIDAQLLWDMLIYERAGRPDAGTDQSIFGKTLKIGTKPNEEDVRSAAEFDLVGSAGISGHKAVSKETPAYAPNEDVPPTPRVLENIPEMDETTPNMEVSVEDRFFEGIGGLDGQEHLFLHANDFGKAIDNWLSLDSPLI